MIYCLQLILYRERPIVQVRFWFVGLKQNIDVQYDRVLKYDFVHDRLVGMNEINNVFLSLIRIYESTICGVVTETYYTIADVRRDSRFIFGKSKIVKRILVITFLYCTYSVFKTYEKGYNTVCVGNSCYFLFSAQDDNAHTRTRDTNSNESNGGVQPIGTYLRATIPYNE